MFAGSRRAARPARDSRAGCDRHGHGVLRQRLIADSDFPRSVLQKHTSLEHAHAIESAGQDSAGGCAWRGAPAPLWPGPWRPQTRQEATQYACPFPVTLVPLIELHACTHLQTLFCLWLRATDFFFITLLAAEVLLSEKRHFFVLLPPNTSTQGTSC